VHGQGSDLSLLIRYCGSSFDAYCVSLNLISEVIYFLIVPGLGRLEFPLHVIAYIKVLCHGLSL